jgi:predicted DNA-binding transcriptional regulator AlpA
VGWPIFEPSDAVSRSELCGIVEATPAPDLPRLIGDLEAAKATAWARLAATPTDGRTDGPELESRNLDVTEAAKRLGMSRDWLYRHASELPFTVRIGRRVVFDSLGLERWNRRHAER